MVDREIFLLKCILCGSIVFNIVTDKLRHNIPRKVVQCNDCSLISLENPTENCIDYSGKEYRESYSTVIGKKTSPQEEFDIKIQFQKARIERVKPLLKPEAYVLEIGCSTGHFLYAIKDMVSKVVGVELDPEHAEFARNHCQLEVYEEHLDKIPLPHHYFDVIFLFQVLEHISNPLEFLSLCKKYLKPSGTIFLEVPNVNDALLSFYKIPTFKEWYYHAPHIYYYSKDTLNRIMFKAGFVGTTKTAQEYTLFNHIHWLLTGNPQRSHEDGYSELKWPDSYSENKSIETSIKNWFQKINKEYKNMLEQYCLSEHLYFEGKPNLSSS